MICHKVIQPSIKGVMIFFTTHLSFCLLVKEFLKLVNIWRNYRQNGDCFLRPICIALLSSKMLISPDKMNNLFITDRYCQPTNRCYVNMKINVNSLSTNIKLLQASFDLLTDRVTPSVTDRVLIMYCIRGQLSCLLTYFQLECWSQTAGRTRCFSISLRC